MGLDQNFTIKKNNEIIFSQDLRKVNCIQGYFEEKYEIDNLETISISKEDIQYLNEKSKYILENKENLTFAKEHLPITKGLFFGNYDYNEYYFEDIEETFNVSKIMLEIIEKQKGITIEYWCWY